MGTGGIILLIFAALIFLVIAPVLVMSGVIYTAVLVRRTKEKWKRECAIPEDEEYKRMFDIGMKWGETWRENLEDVSVENDGLKLKGEYFNFGYERAVIIIAGRMESCLYGWYFAEPFRKAGYNVLTIDNRGHGKSEGKYLTLGFKESGDILAWGRMLHDDFNNKEIVLHGICIGASTAMSALTRPDCPDYFTRVITEGMYTTFYETFKNHMKQDKHPVFPFALGVMACIWLFTGSRCVSNGPVKMVGKLTRPILMLQSREDTFSLPEKAQLLYDKCASPHKKLVWFPKGAHSRVRINNTEEYDSALAEFL